MPHHSNLVSAQKVSIHQDKNRCYTPVLTEEPLPPPSPPASKMQEGSVLCALDALDALDARFPHVVTPPWERGPRPSPAGEQSIRLSPQIQLLALNSLNTSELNSFKNMGQKREG